MYSQPIVLFLLILASSRADNYLLNLFATDVTSSAQSVDGQSYNVNDTGSRSIFNRFRLL